MNRLTRNQSGATGALFDALVHEEVEGGVEVEPAGLAARVDALLIPVAEQREAEFIWRGENEEVS